MKKIKGKILFAAWASKNKKWHTYQLFDKPLRRMFEEVVVFDPQEESYKNGKDEMNKHFIEVVKKEKPDYIFYWFMYNEFDFNTILEARKIVPNMISICYNGDDDYKFYNYTINYFPFIDYFLNTQPDYMEKYSNYKKKAFFACGADTKEFKPIPLKKEYDVSFVGTPKNDRIDYMRYLIENGIKIAVCGSGWEKYPEFKKFHLGEIDHHQFIDLINKSKINICLSKNYFGGTHILERFFEINACKAFGLTEYAEGYFPTFKEGIDIATFKDKKELLEKIKYYLKNDNAREKIALNSYKKTIKFFSNADLIESAFKYISKHGSSLPKSSLPEIRKKTIYLNKKDLNKKDAEILKIVKDYDYVGFKNKGYKFLDFKEYLQLNALELTGKKMSCCDCMLSSSIIGDYAFVSLEYAYDLKDKIFFKNNLDISQVMSRKDYFSENIKKFREFYKFGDNSFINKNNSIMTSVPLVKTKKIKRMPIEKIEHVLFNHFEDRLLTLRNRKKLFADGFIYRLLLYSMLVNPQIIKHSLVHTLKRTKISALVKISRLSSKLFNVKN